MKLNVILCSKSPSKRKAVERAFAYIFPDAHITVSEHEADSGIHNQPIGFEMTMVGAVNRINSVKEHAKDVDYLVSIESGVNLVWGDTILCFSAVCVYGTAANHLSKTLSAAYPLPYDPYYQSIFKDMMGVGEITDKLFGTQNSKSKDGCFGLISNNLSTRDEVDAEAIKGALFPFISKYFKIV